MSLQPYDGEGPELISTFYRNGWDTIQHGVPDANVVGVSIEDPHSSDKPVTLSLYLSSGHTIQQDYYDLDLLNLYLYKIGLVYTRETPPSSTSPFDGPPGGGSGGGGI